MSQIRVLIADPQPLFSEALALALQWWPDIDVIADRPSSGSDLYEQATIHQPDVVVADYWMPDIEGPSVTGMLLERSPQIKVLMLSWLYGAPQIRAALEAGVAGFLPKSVSMGTLVDAIARAHAGEPLVYGEELAQLSDSMQDRTDAGADLVRRLNTLTPRELQILELLGSGWTNDEIARELDVKVKTVKNHTQNILAKMGARSRMEAATVARACGFLPPLPHHASQVLKRP